MTSCPGRFVADAQLVQKTPQAGVYIMTAGKGADDPTALIKTARDVIAATVSHFDYVLIDTPPLLAANDALDFVAEYDLTYPMLKDSDEEAYPDYGVLSFPETFVIDRQGRIAASRRGPVDERFMREEVLPLVEAGA